MHTLQIDNYLQCLDGKEARTVARRLVIFLIGVIVLALLVWAASVLVKSGSPSSVGPPDPIPAPVVGSLPIAVDVPVVEERDGALPSMAPLDVAVDQVILSEQGVIYGDRQNSFVVFNDRTNEPQSYAAVPYQYGYVDLPRATGHVDRPLQTIEDFETLVDVSLKPQVEGDIKLYADGKGQSQIKHLGGAHMDASWEWDVTLPKSAEGMVVALWLFSGHKSKVPGRYQYEFDIEFLDTLRQGPRIELTFHDGKRSGFQFSKAEIDWSEKRARFRIDQYLTAGYCEIFMDDEMLGRITREDVEASGRKWPSVPLYGMTDMWIATTRDDEKGRGLRSWAGETDLSMETRTMTVHGYKVTPSE